MKARFESIIGERLDADGQQNYILRNVIGGLRLMLSDRTTRFYFLVLVGILLVGAFGPALAPHEPAESHFHANGDVKSIEPPSLEHPMGTTYAGYDVLSRILIGARPTVVTGLLGGALIISIGLTVGITAGYVGGRTENILMRITDFFYSIPLIPTAIVLVAFFGIGFWQSILIIGLILWRNSARVLRSQVLQIKNYPFITGAKATGASTPRIIFKHILPNVAPMGVLFFAHGVGTSIIVQAGLSFIGVVDPFTPSWGLMVRNAFRSGYMAQAWWWSLPPGLLIGFTVLATFMFGRGYESVSMKQDHKGSAGEGMASG